MMYYEEIQGKLKELNSELRIWNKNSRHNTNSYVEEYIGVLTRRIADYESLLKKSKHIVYGPKTSAGVSLWDR